MYGKHGTQHGLLQRMIADGADTFAKKVRWVRKHIPSVTDPQAFAGWVVKGERNPAPLPTPPAGFARYRVLSASWGADAVTHKRAMLYSVKAPDGRAGNLIPHAGVYRFHEQLELFGTPVQEEFTLTAPVARGGASSASAARGGAQLGLFANPRRNPQKLSNFSNWFKNSKVVNTNGKPLIVFHGTQAIGTIDSFDRKASRSSESINAIGNWFTTSEKDALHYYAGQGRGQVVPVFLSIQNPLQFNTLHDLIAFWRKHGNGDSIGRKGDPDALRNYLLQEGYDGLMINAAAVDSFAEPNSTYWVALHASQIKHAMENRGTFDATDDRIRNPQVLTGAVREIPDGGGFGIKTFRSHGGKRKAEWLPVPAGLPDWRADFAQGKRLTQPHGLRKSPLVQDVGGRKISEAIAPNGDKVWVGWQVVDLSDLRTSHDPWTLQVNASYPQELQPRDRSRKSYADQIGRLVAQFDPQLLVWSATISDGAPIVGDDGVVESGNGRTMALSRVYRAGGQKADEYKHAVKVWAAELGIPVPKVAHPVLVRVRQTAVDRADFARMANVSAMQLMSAGEQAVTDAASLTSDLILQLDPDRSIGAGANSGFVDGFISQVAGRTARGQLVDEKGRLSKSGENRIDLAIFAFAYGAEAQILINELAEVRESDLRTALSGMLDGSARVARLRAGIAAGLYHAAHDPADGLVGMATFVRAAKLAGQTVDQRLAQSTMFEPLARTSELWLQALRPKGTRLSAAALSAAIVAYCQWVDLYPAGQATMFDDTPPAQVELIERALRGGPEG